MKLLDYQEEARIFLRERSRAYLADGPRTGKTPPACAALRDVLEDGAGLYGEEALILCPAMAIPQWERMWKIFGAERFPIKTLSYNTFIRQPPITHAPGLLILDEAHRCKEVSAQTTRKVLLLARSTPIVWCLSGTPLLNHGGELYPVTRALFEPILRSRNIEGYEEYLDYWFRWSKDDRYGTVKVWGFKNEEKKRDFEKAWEGRMLRRMKVPLPVIQTYPLRAKKLPGFSMDMSEEEVLSAVSLGSFSPFLATLRRYLGDVKAILEAGVVVEEGWEKPRVIGMYHRSSIAVLVEELKKRGVPEGKIRVIDGRTSPERKEFFREEFQRGVCSIVVAQVVSCREGIDLSRAEVLDLVEPEWTPGYNEQFAMRVSNMNKIEPTPIRFMYLVGTIDDGITSVLERKMRVVKGVNLGTSSRTSKS